MPEAYDRVSETSESSAGPETGRRSAPGAVTMGGVTDEPFDDEEDEGPFDPEEIERQLDEFVATADELPGPPVDDLADRVTALIDDAAARIAALLEDVPHNKVLGTQLRLSQRARALGTEDEGQWRLYAASTLLSELVIPKAT